MIKFLEKDLRPTFGYVITVSNPCDADETVTVTMNSRYTVNAIIAVVKSLTKYPFKVEQFDKSVNKGEYNWYEALATLRFYTVKQECSTVDGIIVDKWSTVEV